MSTARAWGWWTEQKLDILSGYLRGFSVASKRAGHTVYLDLFAGQAENVARYREDRVIHGSPRRALSTEPALSTLRFFELPANAGNLEGALRADYPSRDFRVIPGDSNETLGAVLGELAHLNWAPTFAFLDQQSTEVQWRTIERLARYKKRGKPKVELWLLCASGLLPRGLRLHKEVDAGVVKRMNAMFGTDIWMDALTANQERLISPARFRSELTNLMRWQMEKSLGYAHTMVFHVKNTSGTEIFDMIFATDHSAGHNIMQHMYRKALKEQSGLQAQARARRDQQKKEKAGFSGLFDVDELTTPSPAHHSGYDIQNEDLPAHPPYRLP